MKTFASLAAIVAAASAPVALGALHTLADKNSQVVFDDQIGQVGWNVDGVSQLFEQSFHFRIAGDTRESRISTLDLAGTFTTDTNPFTDTAADAFGLLYRGRGLEVEILYTLRGGGAGTGVSDLAEQIALRNTSSSAIALSFFQYVDFDLLGTSVDDGASVAGNNTVRQWEGGASLSETVVTPTPSAFQVGQAGTLSGLLSDSMVNTLNNNASVGSGDLAWSFQWDLVLNPGQTFLISKDKLLIVPSPGSASLLAAGGLLAVMRLRRR